MHEKRKLKLTLSQTEMILLQIFVTLLLQNEVYGKKPLTPKFQ